jgi:nucleoid-associated protein YgaU
MTTDEGDPMPSTSHHGRGAARLTVLLVAAAAAGAGLALRAAHLLEQVLPGSARSAPLGVEGLVELGALALGVLAAAWLMLSAAVALTCVAAHHLGRRWRAGEAVLERVAPAAVRRLARSAVGLGVGTGLVLAPSVAVAADDVAAQDATPAAVVDLWWQPTAVDEDEVGHEDASRTGAQRNGTTQADTAQDDPTHVAATGTGQGHGVDVSDAAGDAAGITAAAPTGTASTVAHDVRSRTDDDGTVVVLRGDTLWDLAASQLSERGPAPSDGDILREMTRWHETNRDVIGDDPDLILPGQVLHVPR